MNSNMNTGGNSNQKANNPAQNTGNRYSNQSYTNAVPSNQPQKGQSRPLSMSNYRPDPRDIPEEELLSVNQLAAYTPFVIKVRVTSKSDIRPFTKATGEKGHLFSVDLIDKEGHEISATFFGDAVDKFYPCIEENKVYFMRDGYVKMVAGKYRKK